jgi:hypothetical protein
LQLLVELKKCSSDFPAKVDLKNKQQVQSFKAKFILVMKRFAIRATVPVSFEDDCLKNVALTIL